VDEKWKSCPACGTNLLGKEKALATARDNECPNCFRPVEADWQTCPSCESVLKRAVSGST
jgi:RNA polymerase subunit RPABC4/transcription elongation factor Spt4